MEDNVYKLFAQLEAFKNRKKPDMSNTGKCIANVEKGKYGNLRCLEVARAALRVGNAVIYSLEGIKFHNVQAKLPTWAKTSLVEGGGKQGRRHYGSIDCASKQLIITINMKNRTKFIRGTSSIGEISLFHAF